MLTDKQAGTMTDGYSREQKETISYHLMSVTKHKGMNLMHRWV